VSKNLKNRVKKLEDAASPEEEEFEEIKIINPNCRVPGRPEIETIRWPKKRKRR